MNILNRWKEPLGQTESHYKEAKINNEGIQL